MTTKINGISPCFDRDSFFVTFEITQELLEAVGDDDEQCVLKLLELLGEVMSELKQIARGEHPRISTRLSKRQEYQGFYEKKYAPDPEWLKKKAAMDALIQGLKAAGMWPPQKP